MQKEWQRQAEANAQPLTNLNSWHNGMVKLQQLARYFLLTNAPETTP